MKIIKINPDNPENKKLKVAIKALTEGKIIIYPTDTVYGIGANIFDLEAVGKVYSIKKRPMNKPLSVCVSKIADIEKIAYLNEKSEKTTSSLFPGPFTVILNKKEHVPSILTAEGRKIGIRIPDNKICMELSKEFPITTTSANLSGEMIPESIEGVLEQLGNKIDLILDAGICKHGIHSTVIDLTVFPPKIVRRGVNTPSFKL